MGPINIEDWSQGFAFSSVLAAIGRSIRWKGALPASKLHKTGCRGDCQHRAGGASQRLPLLVRISTIAVAPHTLRATRSFVGQLCFQIKRAICSYLWPSLVTLRELICTVI
eukprot:UN2551